MGFDLSGITPTYSGKSDNGDGECELMDGFADLDRDKQDLVTFVQSLGVGVGSGNWALVDETTYNDWESFWADGYEADYGDWDDAEQWFSLTAFTLAGTDVFQNDTAPGPLGIGLGYLVDDKWNIVFDDKSAIPLDLSAAATAPTAYYQTLSMYLWGTGFGG
jgi:hypothetical protein